MIYFIADPPYDFRDKDDNHANITHLVKQSSTCKVFFQRSKHANPLF